MRDLRAEKPLNGTGFHVTGISAGSRFNVLTEHVESPGFERIYDVLDGTLTRRTSWSLAIHGGAGVIDRGDLTPEKEHAYHSAIAQALEAGKAVLERGGSALDAVQASLVILEDDPHFNAGRGAAIAADGNVACTPSMKSGCRVAGRVSASSAC